MCETAKAISSAVTLVAAGEGHSRLSSGVIEMRCGPSIVGLALVASWSIFDFACVDLFRQALDETAEPRRSFSKFDDGQLMTWSDPVNWPRLFLQAHVSTSLDNKVGLLTLSPAALWQIGAVHRML